MQQDELQGVEIVSSNPKLEPISSSVQSRTPAVLIPLIPSFINVDIDANTDDLNYPSKTRGFLNHHLAEFSFVGPDRQIHECNSIETYIKMAEAIRDSGLPNYRFARFPLYSNLKIDVLCDKLRDYHDKFLIQYLTYGFPLSIGDLDLIGNTEVSNHHSALQFPVAID